MIILNKISKIIPFLVLLLITFTTTNINYHFGDVNQVELLPSIFSITDSTYLNNDPFVKTTTVINPRYYYSSFLVLINKILPIEISFYLFTLISNYLISLVTYLIIKLFTKDKVFPLLCVFALVNFRFANLGRAGTINDFYLVPQLISMPLILFAFFFSIKGNYLAVLVLSLLSLPIQPTFTLISLVPIIGNLIINKKLNNRYLKILILLLLNCLLTYLTFLRYQNFINIDNDLYIYILAWFRGPHHYIPSNFILGDYIEFLIMLLMLVISMYYTMVKNKKRNIVFKYFICSIILSIILMFFGYFFVEVFPIKQIIELQAFRIVYLVRWISVIIISIAIFEKFSKYSSTRLVKIIYFLFTCIFLVGNKINFNKILLPKISYTIIKERENLFDYISNNTDKNALFLTPPDFGDMRIYPKRAIVVDWKSFPFNETDTINWFTRINDCYGVGDLYNNYTNINEQKITELKNKYNFNYVILNTNTNINLNIIYRDTNYKIYKI